MSFKYRQRFKRCLTQTVETKRKMEQQREHRNDQGFGDESFVLIGNKRIEKFKTETKRRNS